MKQMKQILWLLLAVSMVLGMLVFPAAAAEGDTTAETSTAWDGKTIDVSWYNTTDTEFHIKTPAQLMGLAAIVNGKYHSDITTVIGDDDGTKIVATWTNFVSGYGGQNYGWRGQDDFYGKTIYIDADLDMGGVYNAETGTWSGARFMPISGAYQLDPLEESIDTKTEEEQMATTQINANFCGTLDGQGHTISNIYAELSNGTWACNVGLIGRLGVHDSEGDSEHRPADIGVRNLAITGYICADRSVGGIVGKVSLNKGGLFIENCANFATIIGNQKKGTGGICGAAWNGVRIENCYNAGSVTCGQWELGGITGSSEATMINCFNVGMVRNGTAPGSLAARNGGDSYQNCYWLTGTGTGGLDGSADENVVEKSAEEMKSAEFLAAINGDGRAFVADSAEDPINNGYPILRWQAGPDTATVTELTQEGTPKTAYVEGQKFDANDFAIWANYSDGSREKVKDYTITLGETVIDTKYRFTLEDQGKSLTISGTSSGTDYSYGPYEVTVEKNVPLEIGNVYSTPDPLLYTVGQTVELGNTMAYITFSNGTKTWCYASSDTNMSVNYSSPLTMLDNGKTLNLVYTLNGVSISKEIGTLEVIPKVDADENGTYLIKNADELRWFAAEIKDSSRGNNGLVNAKLMNDIDLSEIIWTAIDNYNGIFDGNGKTVTLNVEGATMPCGLFGTVQNGTIRNVTVDGTISMNGWSNLGGIAAYVTGTATIENCVNNAAVTSIGNNVGGIVGYLYNSAATVTGCTNNGTITGSGYVGGIVGYSSAGLTDCTNNGDVYASNANAGGVVGYAYTADSIYSRCVNTGDISASYAVGGLAGNIRKVYFENCYNTGDVTATAEGNMAGGGAAGLAGYYGSGSSGATFTNCYNSGTITSDGYSAALLCVDRKGAVLTNCYYLGDAETVAHLVTKNGITADSDTVYAKTSDELKAAAEQLGEAFMTDYEPTVNEGYPILDSQHIHHYDEGAVTTAPTCTAAGVLTYTCVCGDTYTEVIPMDVNAHDYVVTTVEPTCTEPGYTSHICTLCGHTYISAVQTATGHSYEAAVTAPTCTELGYTTYTCACGHSYTADYVASTGHTWDEGTVTKEATEAEEGELTYKCLHCDAAYTESIAKLGHTFDEGVVTTPTCDTMGYTTYTCECGYSYTADYVDALGHTLVLDDAVAPTCEETGLTVGVHCSVCDEVLIAQEEIAALGHQEVIVAAVPATCTESGLTEGKYCSVCKTVLVEQEVVSALGHSYGEWTVATAPTCTESGVETRVCAACGETENRETASLGHSYEAVET